MPSNLHIGVRSDQLGTGAEAIGIRDLMNSGPREELNMNIELWPIARLIPYSRNPRKVSKRAISKLADSLKEYKFRQPIVAQRDGVVIVGHTRLLAAQKL